jgi:hypothetical protein
VAQVTIPLLLAALLAQGIPPKGVAVPEADRAELEQLLQKIDRQAEPDRAVVWKAVRWALDYDEILDVKDIAAAKALLKGEPPKPGLAVHAYVSKVDGSVQPYGLVLPSTWQPGDARKRRLDFWMHGRDEKLTELRFLDQRRKSPGEFTPPDTFVLHLYGRFCNASKFAGEVDLFEALEDAKRRYPIDEDRICVRGFSMGGASTWHVGAHHAGRWAAVAPGAGFAETPVYARMFNDPVKPTDYEQKLWRWYNATDYAVNLTNTGVVAYSGELDKQKQAADVMLEAAKAEGFSFPHVIGPKTEHKYEPEAKKEVARLVDALAAKGRDPLPDRVRFTTWTLRYNRMKWVIVEGLEQHWERARVDAELKDGTVTATTSNVSELRFDRPGIAKVVLDGQALSGSQFRKVGGRWEPGTLDGLRKRPGLQGPIDDAFMDGFVAIPPSGPGLNAAANDWATQQFKAAAAAWRKTLRGDFPVAAKPEAKKNLVLFGDPKSNPLIADALKAAGFQWDEAGLRVGGKTYASDRYVPVFVYPMGDRYVVVNSGFTWAENAGASNSRHVPLLPDWAVIDLQAPPKARMSERVAAAGFFDESWTLK